jgi:hypothetical protein
MVLNELSFPVTIQSGNEYPAFYRQVFCYLWRKIAQLNIAPYPLLFLSAILLAQLFLQLVTLHLSLQNLARLVP